MIRLVVADDHPIVREGVKAIVGKDGDMRVIGEAGDTDQTLAIVKTVDPDVLLLDICMPGPGFLETLTLVLAAKPSLRILIFSMHPEDDYAVRALKAGASGYLTKDRPAEMLAEAIRKVNGGETYISGPLADRMISSLRSGATEPHETLSDREYQVLCMLASGQTVGEAASALALSPKTVSTFRSRVLKKLNLKSTAEIVRYAINNHLTD